MNMGQLIAAKRDGKKHTREEIEYLAIAAASATTSPTPPLVGEGSERSELGRGSGIATDAQLSAWLMATYLNGLDEEETTWLTLAMAASGERLNLEGLPHPWVDKHSTGGVGDKTTLILLPLLAACGLTVIKMSGRGLGITGGTIDKLESIPGFRTDLSPAELIEQAGRIGLALTGQTANLAPADKTLYGLRDHTGTVACLPLIVSSILSKKIAGGAERLVLDVKCGSGAFMKTKEEAQRLAHALVETAGRAGLPTVAAITDMDQPLGRCVGNALEVKEALQVLQGRGSARLRELCVSLAGLALTHAGLSGDWEAGKVIAEERLRGGQALEKFGQWIHAQTGGKSNVQALAATLPSAPVVTEVAHNGESGYAHRVDAGIVGQVALDLGAGRAQRGQAIDPAVGIEVLVEVGDDLKPGHPLFRVHAPNTEAAATAAKTITKAIQTTPTPPKRPELIELNPR